MSALKRKETQAAATAKGQRRAAQYRRGSRAARHQNPETL